MQILIDVLLAGCRPQIPLICKVDNTQAITAAHKGYSKKLRFLERTHRCAIGSLHELLEAGEIMVEYEPTATHRGDGFTKALAPQKFVVARDFMGLIQNG